jgi:hypothetical protein
VETAAPTSAGCRTCRSSWRSRSAVRLAGDPVDLLVNGRVIARGEVVAIDEELGLRITEIAAAVVAPGAETAAMAVPQDESQPDGEGGID